MWQISMRNMMASVLFFALLGCGGAPGNAVTDLLDQETDVEAVTIPELPQKQQPLTPDSFELVADELTSGEYFPPTDVVPASLSNASAIIYENSGLIVLPKVFITDDLNEPGAIRNLLQEAFGRDFPQAAKWTFLALNNNDYISRTLWWQFGFYIPSWSPYGLIVVGDEDSFLDELYRDLYSDAFTSVSDTHDVISDIVTSSSSVSATSGSY
jgi:hypothetical protein